MIDSPSGFAPLIRLAGHADWPELQRLAEQAFGESAWSWERWKPMLAPPPPALPMTVRSLTLVAAMPTEIPTELPGSPLVIRLGGFLALEIIHDEIEIQALAVDRSERRRGWGARLLSAAFAHGRAAGCRRAFLEVRVSNEAAQSFYARHGFVACGRRPAYYHTPIEDGLLMSKPLKEA